MSDSLRPHRQQPTRLRRPWDSPGKNTGVGCYFLLQRMKGKSESEVAQSFPTLSDPMDCSLPGSSVHGIFQARVLEWGAILGKAKLTQSFTAHFKTPLTWLSVYLEDVILWLFFSISTKLILTVFAHLFSVFLWWYRSLESVTCHFCLHYCYSIFIYSIDFLLFLRASFSLLSSFICSCLLPIFH